MTGTILSTLYVLIHLLLRAIFIVRWVLILQMRKMRLREVKQYDQSTVRKWQSRDSNLYEPDLSLHS